MSLLIHEIKERLSKMDEISILEILEINSEDLVEAFAERIEEKADELEEELSDEENI